MSSLPTPYNNFKSIDIVDQYPTLVGDYNGHPTELSYTNRLVLKVLTNFSGFSISDSVITSISPDINDDNFQLRISRIRDTLSDPVLRYDIDLTSRALIPGIYSELNIVGYSPRGYMWKPKDSFFFEKVNDLDHARFRNLYNRFEDDPHQQILISRGMYQPFINDNGNPIMITPIFYSILAFLIEKDMTREELASKIHPTTPPCHDSMAHVATAISKLNSLCDVPMILKYKSLLSRKWKYHIDR